MKSVFRATVFVLPLLAAIGCSTAMQDRIARNIVEGRIADGSAVDLDRPGLQVLICGSSGPLPDRERAGPCVAVIAGGRFFLVDAGDGSANNFGLWNIPMQRVDGIFLTHFHSDHIAEIGEYNLQTWAAGRDAPLKVHGPVGVDRVVLGFNTAYELSRAYRTAHHGADFLDPDVGLLEAHTIPLGPEAKPGDSALVLDEGGLVIRAVVVDHAPVSPAVGYRFDYGGRSVFVTGDTRGSNAVAAAASGVDVLVHDAMAHHLIKVAHDVAAEQGRERQAHITEDIPDYHASVVQAAQVAQEAQAHLLVLYHLVPPPTNFLVESIFLRGVDGVRADDVLLAEDGLLIELPPNTDTVQQSMAGN